MRVPDQTQPTTMHEGLPSDAVGRRVACDGERGTVRFVGTVPPTAGLWLGVEWDNPDRGKHDGSHEGVHYFTCRHPKGGSFVRPKKASFGVDYLTAIRRRYEMEVQQVLGEEIQISTRTVEMVGFEAITEKQKVENLTDVALRLCEVSSPGPANEIRNTTPHVLMLDLCGNLLCCWDDVMAVTEQMEELKELQLSHNRLRVPSNPTVRPRAFSCLRVLSLTNCALTWPQLLECAPMWPLLEELYVSENDITELQKPNNVLQSLTVLDLSTNPLVDRTVLSIGELPRLENLNMSKTGLSTLRFDDALPGCNTAMFPALKILAVNSNNISEWSVINELEKLQSLVRLSCRQNPLLSQERNPATAMQLLIARVGRLEALNRWTVLPEDRRGAELDYCKMFGLEWLASGGHRDPQQNRPSAEFTSQHPRYQSLIQKYGAPEDSELKKQEPFALKNQLLSITFVCPDETDRKSVVKKLPDSMIVQKVKGLLYRLLKIPSAELKLSYTSSKMEGKEIEIDNDLKPLQFYSIEDGDKVLVRWL
ncbi:tubulin-specific chaperone E [Salmo trutta]|uniref:Tubulin-specific chaperone E n=1 Tax=Salmo trutta TaxID=8032 RepID=A0A674B551_SALTR|nr:tubulin-specific chaperone E-like [Salmo trutta]XP_029632527.1 tubulin-specific chaperone E-like [Salmo trutta]XP_029632528.1 tubulin-specific chaperone E-like [Salmo trutta]